MFTLQGCIPSPRGPDQDGGDVINPVGVSPCILPRECKSGPMPRSRAKNWQQKSANPALFPRTSPGSTPGWLLISALSTEYLFIPSLLCKRPRYYKLWAIKTVRFPRQDAECMTKLPFPSPLGFFIYSFLSQHRSMVATRLNPCTAYQRLDRGGLDFPSKTILR